MQSLRLSDTAILIIEMRDLHQALLSLWPEMLHTQPLFDALHLSIHLDITNAKYSVSGPSPTYPGDGPRAFRDYVFPEELLHLKDVRTLAQAILEGRSLELRVGDKPHQRSMIAFLLKVAVRQEKLYGCGDLVTEALAKYMKSELIESWLPAALHFQQAMLTRLGDCIREPEAHYGRFATLCRAAIDQAKSTRLCKLNSLLLEAELYIRSTLDVQSGLAKDPSVGQKPSWPWEDEDPTSLAADAPLLPCAMKLKLHFLMYIGGIKMCNDRPSVLIAAHLYYICRKLNLLNCRWNDMEFVLARHKSELQISAFDVTDHLAPSTALASYRSALGASVKENSLKKKLKMRDIAKLQAKCDLLNSLESQTKPAKLTASQAMICLASQVRSQRSVETSGDVGHSNLLHNAPANSPPVLMEDDAGCYFQYVGFRATCFQVLRNIEDRSILFGWTDSRSVTPVHQLVELAISEFTQASPLERILMTKKGSKSRDSKLGGMAAVVSEHLQRQNDYFASDAEAGVKFALTPLPSLPDTRATANQYKQEEEIKKKFFTVYAKEQGRGVHISNQLVEFDLPISPTKTKVHDAISMADEYLKEDEVSAMRDMIFEWNKEYEEHGECIHGNFEERTKKLAWQFNRG